MKNLIAGLLIAVVLVPAAKLKEAETTVGSQRLLATVSGAIVNAAAHNKGHVFVSFKGYNDTQAYVVQRELESKGYMLDISPNLFYIAW